MKKTTEQFLQIPYYLLESNKLSSTDKLLIAYILGWNNSCNTHNSTLAKILGIPYKTLQKTITKLNKLPFFNSRKTSSFNELGKWSNTKLMTVDQEKLKEYINDETTPTEKKEPVIKNEEPKKWQSNDKLWQQIEEGKKRAEYWSTVPLDSSKYL